MSTRDTWIDDFFQPRAEQPNLLNLPTQDGRPWLAPLVADTPMGPLDGEDARQEARQARQQGKYDDDQAEAYEGRDDQPNALDEEPDPIEPEPIDLDGLEITLDGRPATLHRPALGSLRLDLIWIHPDELRDDCILTKRDYMDSRIHEARRFNEPLAFTRNELPQP